MTPTTLNSLSILLLGCTEIGLLFIVRKLIKAFGELIQYDELSTFPKDAEVN